METLLRKFRETGIDLGTEIFGMIALLILGIVLLPFEPQIAIIALIVGVSMIGVYAAVKGSEL